MAKVGLGVIIKNSDGKILLGKRKGDFVPFWSIPGGGLEDGETFEEGARREIFEETGLVLNSVKVISVTNNLDTYKKFGKHTVSITLFSDDFSGNAAVLEPDKCEVWDWFDPSEHPEPKADFSVMSVENYLNEDFYKLYY